MRGTLHWDVLGLYARRPRRAAGRRARAARVDSVGRRLVGASTSASSTAPAGSSQNPVHYRDARRAAAVDGVLATRARARALRAHRHPDACRSTRSSSSPRWRPRATRRWRRRDAAADPRPRSLLALRERARPSSRTRRRRSASTPRAAAGRPTSSSGSTCRRGSSPRSSTRHGARPLAPSVAEETRLGGARVVAVATHDTGSAVAAHAAPASPAPPSSASAPGRSSASRSTEPLIGDATFAANLTNEGGVGGTFRAAAQRHRALAAARVPARLGRARAASYSFDELVALARDCAAAAVARRPERPVVRRARATCRRAIADVLRATGQPEPADAGAVARCILESLALKHARDDRPARRGHRRARSTELHVVGGGARNELLCRWTAERRRAARCSPGPAEATLVGNLLVQAIALGELGSLAEAREVVRRSFAPTTLRARADCRLARGARALRRARRAAGAGGARVSEAGRRPRRHPRARATAGTTPPRRASTPLDGARLPLEPARRRPRAREPGRRQHVGEGDARRPRRPRGARALGEGLGHRPRDDHRRRLRRRSASTSCCRCASGTRWTTRRWSTTCSAAPLGPTSRGRRSRRCCTRSCRRRTSTTRTPTP